MSGGQTEGKWYTIDDRGRFADVATIKGRRFAVLLHGLGGDHRKLAALGQWLAAQCFALGDKLWKYDGVLMYEYDSYSAGIDELSRAFAASFFRVFAGPAYPRIDGYAVSLGGVMLRTAIKFHALGKAMERVTTFSSFGEGIPKWIIDILRAAGLDPRAAKAPALADLTEGSEFITRLTTTPSPYRGQAVFYTFAGRRYYTYGPHIDPVPNPIIPDGPPIHSDGELMNAVYAMYYKNQVPNDGLVPVAIIQSKSLALDSLFWENNDTARYTLDLDHGSIAGIVKTPTPGDPLADFAGVPTSVAVALLDTISRP